MPKTPCTPLLCAFVAFFTISSSRFSHAQEQAALTPPSLSASDDASSSSSSLPDDPAQEAHAQAPHQDVQTKRILGVIPNFRAVTADQHPPAQSVKDKFITASQDSFDYSSLLLPVVVAGINQARNNTPEFHQGAPAYGRYFWHSYVDQAVENYSVEFIVPVITHEDTRYYTLGKGGFLKRAGYSLSRVVVTRSDKGADTVNISEIVGAGMGAGISNLYYPSPERTFSNTAQMWGTNIGIDAATFLFKEFWPDINHSLFHQQN
ncbi:hypothetical protein [Granulicella sp. WH15]|uniref:hypothetical protein n=1 Tax=Granulicella sp. WH15 TaxID=2602070 RepID=UPI0015F2E65B|nr:hypothetical protein [Granulicella sp. WH15]